MSSRTPIATGLGILALSLSAGLAVGQTPGAPFEGDALRALKGAAPALRTHTAAGDKMVNTRLWGTRMITSRLSADDAAERFVKDHASALGVRDAELVRTKRIESSTKSDIVYHYQQTFGGVPVENSVVRVVVKPGNENAVVYASGRLAPEPDGGFAQPEVTPEEAIERVRLDIAFKGLPIWEDAELVAYFNEDANETTLAWKFQGGTEVTSPKARAFTFFVDAFTAEIIEARSAIWTAETPINATGFGTPGNQADTGSNPPVQLPIPGLRITNDATGEFAFTDNNGDALVPNSGPVNVPFVSNFDNGLWLDINDEAGPTLFESGTFTDGVGGAFVFNTSPNEFTTAQVNTFIHTNLIHDFMNTYAPVFAGVDIQIDANVNIADSCNAFFSNFGELSINFFTAGVDPFSGLECNNTAFASVVAHEYGHFIVNRLGLAQAEFGEGYGDVCSMLLYDDPVIGRDFRVDGGVVRDPANAGLTFPCSPGPSVHFCGQVLGGLWWDIREELGASLGEPAGLEATRTLFGNWSLITGGGVSGQSAHPATAIELLVADDDDGNIENGTPNYEAICAALASRNIDCPPLALLSLSSAQDEDGFVPANQNVPVSLEVEEVTSTVDASSGQLLFSVDGGAFQSVPLADAGGNVFEAALPATECASIIEYYFTIQDAGGFTVTSPADAPSSTFSVTTAESTGTPYETSFEVDASGFTAGLAGDTATTGQWTLGDPNGTVAQPEDDNTADGVNCFFTGQANPGDGQGTNDVDGGFTTLLSPEINLASFEDAVISYARWYRNDTGDSPNADTFRVDIRLAGSGDWQSVEVVGPSGPGTSGGWIESSFNVSDFFALPATVQLRFIAEDGGNGSIVEAAVDDVTVTGISCEAVAQCVGDCDSSGAVDFGDLVSMLFQFGNDTGAGCDADDSGEVNFADLVAALFLFGPCP